MEINAGNINALTTDIKTAFAKYRSTVPPEYEQIAMTIPSSSGENFYPQLVELPGFREWVGERVIHHISMQKGFVIANRTFEQSFSLSREDLEDDKFGFLMPIVQQLAKNADTLPDHLVYDLLEKGHVTRGIDGQYYFDTDHQAYGRDGKPTGFSNILRPSSGEQTSPAWYLFNTTNPIKPMIYQERRPFTIVPRTQLSSDVVFHENKFEWGSDGRCNAGYGLHNLAFRSTAPLTGQNLATAVAMMKNQYRKDGTPYLASPDLLIAPNALEGTARALLEKDTVPVLAPDGKTWVAGSNPWSKTMKLSVSSYLNSLPVTD